MILVFIDNDFPTKNDGDDIAFFNEVKFGTFDTEILGNKCVFQQTTQKRTWQKSI